MSERRITAPRPARRRRDVAGFGPIEEGPGVVASDDEGRPEVRRYPVTLQERIVEVELILPADD